MGDYELNGPFTGPLYHPVSRPKTSFSLLVMCGVGMACLGLVIASVARAIWGPA